MNRGHIHSKDIQNLCTSWALKHEWCEKNGLASNPSASKSKGGINLQIVTSHQRNGYDVGLCIAIRNLVIRCSKEIRFKERFQIHDPFSTTVRSVPGYRTTTINHISTTKPDHSILLASLNIGYQHKVKAAQTKSQLRSSQTSHRYSRSSTIHVPSHSQYLIEILESSSRTKTVRMLMQSN